MDDRLLVAVPPPLSRRKERKPRRGISRDGRDLASLTPKGSVCRSANRSLSAAAEIRCDLTVRAAAAKNYRRC